MKILYSFYFAPFLFLNAQSLETKSTLKQLTLHITKTTLNKDTNTTIKVEALYNNNKKEDITTKVKWIIKPNDAIAIKKNTLIAKKDSNVTLQAKYNNTISNKVELTIYWEVDGHRLPPEPDPKVNNSTLLGIDSNNNGVRDDVERWIYKRYKEYVPCHQVPNGNVTLPDGTIIPVAKRVCEEHPVPYHPVVRAVAMQGARAAQIIIQHPEKAQETLPVWNAAIDCDSSLYITYRNKNTYPKDVLNQEFDAIQFNTVTRARAYAKFNYYLSGGVYEVPTYEDGIKQCDKEVKKYLKELK